MKQGDYKNIETIQDQKFQQSKKATANERAKAQTQQQAAWVKEDH